MGSLTTIILATVASGAVSSFIVAVANWSKNRAQVHNMNIEGDLKIGDNWKEYARQITQDMNGVKQELTLVHNKYLDLEKKYNDLYAEHVIVVQENISLKDQVIDLSHKVEASETRIEELQAELSKYKQDNQ